MRISYDKKADAMNIRFHEGKYEISEEVAEGIILDKSKDGKILSIEILDASKRLPRNAVNEISAKAVEAA
jgi:uncharacterized protein YuzE